MIPIQNQPYVQFLMTTYAVIGVLGTLGTEVEAVFQQITDGLNPPASST